MKYRNILIISFFVSSLWLGAQDISSNENWKLEKDKDGILVYTRSVEGLKIKEFKAETIIHSEIEVLEKMLLEVGNYEDWIDKLKFAEISKEVSLNEFYVYSEVDVPWPFDDRDIVTLDKVIRNEKTGEFKMLILGVEGIVVEKDGIVRIKESRGFWSLLPEKEESTKVIYQYLADPGGGIPDWLINAFLVDSPFNTLSKMKEIAEKND